jgi:hypothetical protein
VTLSITQNLLLREIETNDKSRNHQRENEVTSIERRRMGIEVRVAICKLFLPRWNLVFESKGRLRLAMIRG